MYPRYLFLACLLISATLVAISFDAGIQSGAAAMLPTSTTIVNYNFNAGTSYITLTPTLAPGITSTASGTQPFQTGAGTATDANAFTPNTTPGPALLMFDSSGTNTRYYQFQLGGAALVQNRSYKVYVQGQRTASAATTITLAYSTDGTNFTNFAGTLSAGLGTFSSMVFDLSQVVALDHRGSIYFRLLVSGAPSSSPGLAMDNFQVQAETVSCSTSFTVNNTTDTHDAEPGDGVCDDGSGGCTLRAALEESNALTFCSAPNINFAVTGPINLDSSLPTITRQMTLNGPGANTLAITGNGAFRLLNILLSTPGTVTINDLSFTRGGKGAGQNATAVEFNNNGTLNLNRVEFFNNSGGSGSSVIFSNAAAALNLNGCSIHHNPVEHVLMIGNTPFSIANSTISNNTGTGAAIFVFGGTVGSTITGSTIANNNQGLWHVNTSVPSTVTLRNSIFSQNGNVNLRRTGAGSCAENGIFSGGYNLIDNDPGSSLCASESTDLIGTSFNPQLAPLGYYGGTTQSRPPALTSPVIDKGRSFGLTTDQRSSGRTREIPGIANAAGGDGTDMGSVEVGTIVNSLADTGDTTPDGVCDDGSGNCTLREALQEANFVTGADSITFTPGLTGTITLGSSLPLISQPVNIIGPGANSLTISGNGSFRLVNILLSTPATMAINDVSFAGGGKGAGQNATAVEFNNNGTLNLNRVEFFNNSGGSGSSVIFSNAAAALNLNGCSIHHNSVEHVVMIGNTPFSIANSTISNNTGTGAAIFVFGGTVGSTITGSTITNNNQGLWHVNSSVPSTVTLRNSIFSQNGNVNLRRTGAGSCAENGILSGGYNLIDNDPGSSLCTSESTDLIGTSFNPRLTPLANYGGPTRAQALLAGSAALDKGHSSGLSADQRGQVRPFDNPSLSPAAGGDQSDIGAFELQASCNAINIGPTLPNWNTSSAYNQTLTATGGNAPYTFAIVEGSLPSDVTLSLSGGLTGTPSATGTFNFTVLATDSVGCLGVRSYAIAISDCPSISLNPATLPNGSPGVVYSQSITASGGSAPYTYTATGTLPTGLMLSAAGLLSGTPSVAGVFNFSVTATANNGCQGVRGYQIIINAPPVDISLSSATIAENSASGAGVGTFTTADADSHTFVYTMVGGSGSADNSSFTLSGAQLLTNGVFDFEAKSSYGIRVRSTDQTGLFFEKSFTISVTNVNEAPTISSISDQVILAGSTTGPLSFTIGDPETTATSLTVSGSSDNAALVPIDTAHITFSGSGASRSVTITPAAPQVGSARITITVSDGTLMAADEFELTVNCTSLTLSGLPAGLVNRSYSQAIVVGGGSGSYTFSADPFSLPPGLTLSPAGLLNGVPTSTGTFTFAVNVTDANTGCTGARNYRLVIGDPVTAGQVVISEFRFRGIDIDDSGPLTSTANEFIEFYNRTSADIVVSSGDGSAGWALLAADGAVRFIVPNGTILPALGHFLAVNTEGYGLTNYAAGDSVLLPDGVTQAAGFAIDIPDGSGVALFNSAATFNSSTRLDAVGFSNFTDQLYREGTGLAPATGITANIEHAFVRQFVNGLHRDNDDNATDFQFISTDGGTYNEVRSLLGAPGPQSTVSARNRNAAIQISLIDPTVSTSIAPNRVRDLTSDPAANATFGTLSIRRRVTNNTGRPITSLRFRVIEITAFSAETAVADIRAINSESTAAVLTDSSVVTVLGTTLESPPAQPLGGGLNSSLAVTGAATTSKSGKVSRLPVQKIMLAEPLAPGDSVNVQFLLGVQRSGLFRFYINVEAVTQ